MPIDIDTFERESAFETEATNATRVLGFLAENDAHAFERGEIADATGIDPNTVSAVLSRLKARELVRHKPPYWAIGDAERLRGAADLETSVGGLNDTLGTEDMDVWRAAGADGPHPSARDAE